LWRCKLDPLVDSQEYKDIIKTLTVQNQTAGPLATPGPITPLQDIMSTYNKYMDINNAIVQQAEVEVPKSGYDVSKIYSLGADKDGNPAKANLDASDAVDTADGSMTADAGTFSPVPIQNPKGYLTGDGLAPNGLPVGAGVAFPADSHNGDYYLRLDYLPNRLFRFDGKRWVKMEDNVRTNITPGATGNTTLRNSFMPQMDANNKPVSTLTLSNGDVIPELQGLSKILRPKADY
jgi:hypothetical protein